MSVSLDGFVSDREDGWDCVLAWYSKPQPPRGSAVDPDRDLSGLGVIVAGRRTFGSPTAGAGSTRPARQ